MYATLPLDVVVHTASPSGVMTRKDHLLAREASVNSAPADIAQMEEPYVDIMIVPEQPVAESFGSDAFHGPDTASGYWSRWRWGSVAPVVGCRSVGSFGRQTAVLRDFLSAQRFAEHLMELLSSAPCPVKAAVAVADLECW